MAVVECIPEKKQTPSAQKGVIDYCIQPSKTYDDEEQLAYVSGYNCIPELVTESFLATQKIFGHEPDGVRFYHYVQSFRIGEKITPQEAHEIGMEFAKSFGYREVLVATHIDREHIHNHLVVCAYDLESGIKFKRLILRMQYILRDRRGEGNPPTIPDHIRMEIARCLLPDIIAFCESEQGKREFEEWKKKRMVENKEEKKLYKKIRRNKPNHALPVK